MVLRSIFLVSMSAFGGNNGRSLYGILWSNLLIFSSVNFTLANSTRVKIRKIYSRLANEGKNYARSVLMGGLHKAANDGQDGEVTER